MNRYLLFGVYVYPSVFDYLTKHNKPTKQDYYITDDEEIWEISYFENESKSEFDKRMNALEYLSKKINLAEALGVI